MGQDLHFPLDFCQFKKIRGGKGWEVVVITVAMHTTIIRASHHLPLLQIKVFMVKNVA